MRALSLSCARRQVLSGDPSPRVLIITPGREIRYSRLDSEPIWLNGACEHFRATSFPCSSWRKIFKRAHELLSIRASVMRCDLDASTRY